MSDIFRGPQEPRPWPAPDATRPPKSDPPPIRDYPQPPREDEHSADPAPMTRPQRRHESSLQVPPVPEVPKPRAETPPSVVKDPVPEARRDRHAVPGAGHTAVKAAAGDRPAARGNEARDGGPEHKGGKEHSATPDATGVRAGRDDGDRTTVHPKPLPVPAQRPPMPVEQQVGSRRRVPDTPPEWDVPERPDRTAPPTPQVSDVPDRMTPPPSQASDFSDPLVDDLVKQVARGVETRPVKHHEVDTEAGKALAEGRKVDITAMNPADAGVASGAAAIVVRNIGERRTVLGIKVGGDRSPRELPRSKAIVAHLATAGATASGLVCAAESLRAKDDPVLRRVANDAIAKVLGENYRRSDSYSTSVLLLAGATCMIGDALDKDPDNTPGGVEFAAGILEGLDRLLHHLPTGMVYGKEGVPREVTDLRQLYSHAREDAFLEGDSRETELMRIANVAIRYAKKHQPGIDRPALEREATIRFAKTLFRPASEVAEEGHVAASELIANPLRIDEITDLAQRRLEGDQQAAYELERFERHAATALRATMALAEQSEEDPEAAQEFEQLWRIAKPNLLRYAYSQKDQISQGNGVTPELALLITDHTPIDSTEQRIVDELEAALTDAAFIHYKVPAYKSQEIGGQRFTVRTADEYLDPNSPRLDPEIPDFVREAYVSDLATVPAHRLGPRNAVVLATSIEIRRTRLYECAREISDLRGLPDTLREKYEFIMKWGKPLEREFRRQERATRSDKLISPIKRMGNRLRLPPKLD